MIFRCLRQYLNGVVISLALALALCLLSLPISAAAGTAAFSVSGPSQPVNPGAQFTVSIPVQPNSAIAGAQFNLSFNPSLVTVNSIVEGNLLKQNGDNTYFTSGRIDNSAGTLTGVAGTIITPGATVSGPGTFAVITMTASSIVGTCPLTISNVIAGDVNARSVPVSTVNGNITVGTIGLNQPPVLSAIGDKAVTAGSSLTFTLSATDPEANPLTYSASNLPSGASFDASSRTFLWAPTSSQTGTYLNVHFEVFDGTLGDSENIKITVSLPAYSGNEAGGGGGGGGSPPIATPANISIGNNGVFNQTVSVSSDDKLAELMVDQGTKGLTKDGNAISKITIISVQSPAAQIDQSNIIGSIYNFGPDGATFDPPINLTLTYNPSLMPKEVDESNLVVATWDTISSKWVALESSVNHKNSTITAKVNHFSIFSVLARTRPASLVISDITAVPAVVNVNDNVSVSTLITNTGDLEGTFDITLKMDNVNLETQNVTLAGGANQMIRFTVTPDSPGTHALSIGYLSAKLVVEEPAKATFVTSKINIDKTQVDAGETVTISALVINTGNISGTYSVMMKINGNINGEKVVTAGAGVGNEVNFEVQEFDPGNYTADVDRLSVQFVVKDAAPVPAVSSELGPTEFSLSLLAEIVGGAFILIIAAAFLLVLRRRQLLKKEHN